MSLPAGYVDLGFMAMHTAKLRKHTTDIHRFQKYVSLAVELEPTAPHSAESVAVFERADCEESLRLTCRELAQMWLLTAADLEASN